MTTRSRLAIYIRCSLLLLCVPFGHFFIFDQNPLDLAANHLFRVPNRLSEPIRYPICHSFTSLLRLFGGDPCFNILCFTNVRLFMQYQTRTWEYAQPYSWPKAVPMLIAPLSPPAARPRTRPCARAAKGNWQTRRRILGCDWKRRGVNTGICPPPA